MQQNKVTFLNLPKSEYIEKEVEKKIEMLKTIFEPIMKCDVTLSYRRFHNKLGHYQAEILIAIPNQASIICRISNNRTVRGIYIAVRDAFTTAEHLLKKRIQHLRHFKHDGITDVDSTL